MPGIVFMLIGSLHGLLLAIGLTLMIFGGIFALVGGAKYYADLSKYIGE
jgi:hypothetical protein